MQISRQYFFSSAVCLMYLAGIAGAYAQAPEAVADAQVQSVKITGVRDPAMMPYKDAYDTLTRLQEVGKGRVEFRIRVVSSKTQDPIPGLDVSLAGPNTFEKIPVSENGYVNVPLSESAYADKAEFITNQKKGTIGVHMSLLPKLPSGQFKYADIVEAVEAGERVRKVLIPWYLRLFVPSVKAVAICYPDNQQRVTLSDGPMPTRLARVWHRDGKERVFCADFEAGDRSIPKDSVIAPAPGWRAIYL